MNLVVAFEAILVVCCLISLNLARQAFFPASLFWAFGAACIGITAALGGFKFAGFGAVETYHTTAKHFAGSIGIAAFVLGALAGLFADFFARFYWWILLVLLAVLCAALLFGHWRFSSNIQMGLVGVIFLVGLVRLLSAGMLAIYLILGVVCLVLSKIAVKWLALNTGMDPLNIYHVLVSLAVVSFGLAASRDDWE
ncbi:hypothetical protein [Sneathiella litorea]|uniref:Uncharacterized protein n=1 Tax=Sneathiella litorea TaxID=2606216 RepID=A0A6L8W4I2_9PROT|nr:hypothetical protein [Sneathiella litorea]MZR30006.1 hypothetical protein [Sneathiella litorea]